MVTAAEATGPWTLIASYPTPGPNPRGYAKRDPSDGFIVQDGSNPYVYWMYWYTWEIMASFPAPGGPGAWGIDVVGNEVYLSNNRTSWIYYMDRAGSVISSFRCPIEGPADMQRRVAPPYLHVAIPDRNVIALLDRTTGSLVSTLRGPGLRPTACGGYSSFYVADAATHTVYENGVPVITELRTPVGFDFVALMDGPYEIGLFVVDDATDRLYMYEDSTAVVPASLGRVKALHR
jgi:hypothetical protein